MCAEVVNWGGQTSFLSRFPCISPDVQTGDAGSREVLDLVVRSLTTEVCLQRDVVNAPKQEARAALFEWIVWYNNERLHRSLDYKAPQEYEESWDQAAETSVSDLPEEH